MSRLWIILFAGAVMIAIAVAASEAADRFDPVLINGDVHNKVTFRVGGVVIEDDRSEEWHRDYNATVKSLADAGDEKK